MAVMGCQRQLKSYTIRNLSPYGEIVHDTGTRICLSRFLFLLLYKTESQKVETL